jgi:hypothetical protein
MADGPRDGLSGFLFGVAIATLLFGIWRTHQDGGGHSGCGSHS